MHKESITPHLKSELEEKIPGLMEQQHVPGLSLVLIKDADIFFSLALGVRSSYTHEQLSEDTLFEAASLSKPVFAYAALKLCEGGILDLDRLLNDYLPELTCPMNPDRSRSACAMYCATLLDSPTGGRRASRSKCFSLQPFSTPTLQHPST